MSRVLKVLTARNALRDPRSRNLEEAEHSEYGRAPSAIRRTNEWRVLNRDDRRAAFVVRIQPDSLEPRLVVVPPAERFPQFVSSLTLADTEDAARATPGSRWSSRKMVSQPRSRQLRRCFELQEDLVDDARDGYGGGDYSTVLGSVFFRPMQSRNEFPFRWLSAAPPIVRSLVKPPIQCVKVDFKDEDAVK